MSKSGKKNCKLVLYFREFRTCQIELRAENCKGLILLYIERKADQDRDGRGEEGLFFQEQQS